MTMTIMKEHCNLHFIQLSLLKISLLLCTNQNLDISILSHILIILFISHLFFRFTIVLQISKRSCIRVHVTLQHEINAKCRSPKPVTMESASGTNIRSSRSRSSVRRRGIGEIFARYIGRPFFHVSHRRW